MAYLYMGVVSFWSLYPSRALDRTIWAGGSNSGTGLYLLEPLGPPLVSYSLPLERLLLLLGGVS